MSQSYNTVPSTSTVCLTHGYESTKHFLPKHGYLVAPAAIKAKVFTKVIELTDGTTLNIKQALEWVKSKEVRMLIHVHVQLILFPSALSQNKP